VDGVVALGEIAGDLDQLQADDLQPTVLVPGEDPAGQQALNAVGLDQDEGAFVHWQQPARGGVVVSERNDTSMMPSTGSTPSHRGLLVPEVRTIDWARPPERLDPLLRALC
jgi:hypothetical protein